MAEAADWQQRDEYYWAGPEWAANGTRHGMEPTLAAAIMLCDKVKG
ncbi:hypothetical protein WJ973_25550 [Achromobacter xylosoxidans]